MPAEGLGIKYRISSDVSGLVQGVEVAQSRLQSLQKKAHAVQASLSGVASPLFRGMTKGALVVGGALAGITASALSAGGDFEALMGRVGALSGATGEDLERLTQKARQLGRDLPASAEDAASAFVLMAQKGWDVSKMMSSVEGLVNLSITQNTSIAEATDLVGAALTNFKLDAAESTRVVDMFNNASAKSNLTMEKLAYALRYAGPLAKSIGASLEETLGYMGALADAGLQGEQIGTGLRAVMMKIAAAANDGGAAFKSMGFDVTDANGKLLPMMDIIKTLGKGGLTAAQATKLFGTEAATAAVTLASASGNLDSFVRELLRVGTTQEMVTKRMKEWGVSWVNLTSSIADTRISVFDQIKGQAVELVNNLTDLTNVFNEWVQDTGIAGKVLVEMARGFGISISSVQDFKAALYDLNVEEIAGYFRNFAGTVRAVGKSFAALVSMVPWEFLLTHLKGIGLTIFGLWASSKIAGAISNVLLFASAMSKLSVAVKGLSLAAAAPHIGALLGLLTGMSVVGATNAVMDHVEAMRALRKSVQESDDELRQLGGDEVERRLERLREKLNSLGFFSGLGARDKLEDEIRRLEAIRKEISDAKQDSLAVPEETAWTSRSAEADVLNIKKAMKAARDEVRKAKEEMFSSSDDLLREWERRRGGVLKDSDPMSIKIRGGVVEAMRMYDELQSKADNAAKRMGVPFERLAPAVAQAWSKEVKKIASMTADATNNPFVAQAVQKSIASAFEESGRAADEMGKASKEAMEEMVKGVDGARSSLDKLGQAINGLTNPLSTLTEAMKKGFLSGNAAREAMQIVKDLSSKVAEKSKEQMTAMMEQWGVKPGAALLQGLQQFQIAENLARAGLTVKSTAPQQEPRYRRPILKGSVDNVPVTMQKTIHSPVSINIHQMNVRDAGEAERIARRLGENIVRPIEMSS